MAWLLLNASEIELLQRLNASSARYLVVGGHAVTYHGHHREMKDLDIFIGTDAANANCVIAALSTLGLGGDGLTAETLSRPNTQLPLGRQFTVELLTSLAGIDFEIAYANRVIAEKQGTPISIIGLADLLATKRATGRPKDLADIEGLDPTLALRMESQAPQSVTSTRKLIRFKTADEFRSRPAYRDNLDPTQYKLKEIIGDYSFARKDHLPCGLKNCRTKHQHGYVVGTDQGPETHIGNKCGKNYFNVNWGEIKAEYNRAKESRNEEEWLQKVLEQSAPLLDKARHQLQELYDLTGELSRLLLIVNQERQLVRALADAAKVSGALQYEEEIDEGTRAGMGLSRNDRFRTRKVGQLIGIEAAVPPRGDTRLRGQARADQLRSGDIPDLEKLSTATLSGLGSRARKAKITQLEGIQYRLQETERLITQTRQFLAPANLRELGKLPVANLTSRAKDILETFVKTPG